LVILKPGFINGQHARIILKTQKTIFSLETYWMRKPWDIELPKAVILINAPLFQSPYGY